MFLVIRSYKRLYIKMNLHICVCVFVQIVTSPSACAHMCTTTVCRRSLCLQVCLSVGLHLLVSVSVCVCVCVCVRARSCPRCALLISYQGSLFAGWQVAISPLIQGLLVRWELHWEHMTKHFTSASLLTSSLSVWFLPCLSYLPLMSRFPLRAFLPQHHADLFSCPLSFFLSFSPSIFPSLLLLYLFFLPWTTSSSALGVKKKKKRRTV